VLCARGKRGEVGSYGRGNKLRGEGGLGADRNLRFELRLAVAARSICSSLGRLARVSRGSGVRDFGGIYRGFFVDEGPSNENEIDPEIKILPVVRTNIRTRGRLQRLKMTVGPAGQRKKKR
jgi:hypothetical protein